MGFSTNTFLFIFLLGTLAVYIPTALFLPRLKVPVLLAASLIFYSWADVTALPVLLAMLASCLLSAVSGTMDKLLMRTGEITSGQLQFWYLFFLTAMYLVFILVKRVPVRPKMVVTNLWIPVMAVLFVLSDRALFIANADPSSKLAVMTVLKQSAGFVSVLIGKFFFREEGVWKRLACGALILCGIVISLL